MVSLLNFLKPASLAKNDFFLHFSKINYKVKAIPERKDCILYSLFQRTVKVTFHIFVLHFKYIKGEVNCIQ